MMTSKRGINISRVNAMSDLLTLIQRDLRNTAITISAVTYVGINWTGGPQPQNSDGAIKHTTEMSTDL